MKIEIDQSGKIEETNKNTILAFSNGEKNVIVITANIKRQLQEIFRRQGQPKLFIYRTFTAGIFLLVKPYLGKITDITIDIEWTGKERLISDIFSEFIQKNNLPEKPILHFQLLGKESKAHILAWNIYKALVRKSKKMQKPKIRKLTFKQLFSLALKFPIKKDRGLKID